MNEPTRNHIATGEIPYVVDQLTRAIEYAKLLRPWAAQDAMRRANDGLEKMESILRQPLEGETLNQEVWDRR